MRWSHWKRSAFALGIAALSGAADAGVTSFGLAGRAGVTQSGGALKEMALVSFDNYLTAVNVLNNSPYAANISGLAIQVPVSAVMGTVGTYTWAPLDTAVSVATSHGLLFNLYFVATPASNLPTAGVSCGLIGGVTGSIAGKVNGTCIPWDAAYATMMENLYLAAMTHYTSLGLMSSWYSIGAAWPDQAMQIFGCANGSIGTVAYSRSSYLTAWQNALTFFTTNFPAQKIFVPPPVNDIVCPPTVDTSFAPSAFGSFIPGQVQLWGTDGTNTGSPVLTQALSDGYMPLNQYAGYQMLGSSVVNSGFVPGDLVKSVCWLVNNSFTEWEPYIGDINRCLLGSSTPCPRIALALQIPNNRLLQLQYCS